MNSYEESIFFYLSSLTVILFNIFFIGFILKNGHKVYGFDRKESTIEHPDYKHYCLDIRDKEMYPELPPMQIVIKVYKMKMILISI